MFRGGAGGKPGGGWERLSYQTLLSLGTYVTQPRYIMKDTISFSLISDLGRGLIFGPLGGGG